MTTYALINFSPWLHEDLWLAGVEGQTDGKYACSSGEGGTDGKDLPMRTCICGSAHDCGCMVDGSNVMVASWVLLFITPSTFNSPPIRVYPNIKTQRVHQPLYPMLSYV